VIRAVIVSHPSVFKSLHAHCHFQQFRGSTAICGMAPFSGSCFTLIRNLATNSTASKLFCRPRRLHFSRRTALLPDATAPVSFSQWQVSCSRRSLWHWHWRTFPSTADSVVIEGVSSARPRIGPGGGLPSVGSIEVTDRRIDRGSLESGAVIGVGRL
jgi:hypothetical protein